MRLDRPEAPRVDLPPARLVGVSRRGELAVVLGRSSGERRWMWQGTLARVPLSGGTPRGGADRVYAADWAPGGSERAGVRDVEGEMQLEFPLGRTVVRGIGVAGAGFAFRVSPRGDKVAVVSPDGITIVDREGKATSFRGVEPDETVEGLAWDPSGDALWAGGGKTSNDSSGLWRIGLDGSAREVARMPGPAYVPDVAADGRVLIHRGFERDGARARGPGEAVEHELAANNWGDAITLSDDGRELLLFDVAEPPIGWSFLRPMGGGSPMRIAEG